jgi:xanthine dehydrogenase accessory factor
MSGSWIDAVVRAVTVGPVVRALVIKAKGSTPREVGAWMLISREEVQGTIGGGALEYACIARAHGMLDNSDAAPWVRAVESFHLGPELNQCCGGAMTILLERFGPKEAAVLIARDWVHNFRDVSHPLASGWPISFVTDEPLSPLSNREPLDYIEPLEIARTPLVLYGAGNVGRALARALEGLPFALTWYDAQRKRVLTDGRDVEAELSELAGMGASGSYHVVMTHSHALDEAIVTAVLQDGIFAYLGLIGSATKAARFRQRLLRSGLDPHKVAQMHCPIGLPGLAGKAPAVIAASVAADLLLRRQKQIDPVSAVQ